MSSWSVIDLLINYSSPSMSIYWRFKFVIRLFLEVQNQNTSYSTLSISLWALEILALSLGVFSPTWKMENFHFSKTNPHLLGKQLHLLFETKLCTVWWPLWKEEHQKGGIYLFLQHNLKAGENFRWICKFDSKPVESFFSCFSCSILCRGSLQEIRIIESWKFIQTNNKGDSPVNFLCSNNRWGVSSGLKGESSQNISSKTSIVLTYPFREIEFTEGGIQQVLSLTDKGLKIKIHNLQSF